MAKTYMEELAQWVKERGIKKQRQDKHVVAFLAVKPDVQRALDAGYSMKTIWEHMRETGRLQCRYETFTLHVKRYVKTPALESSAAMRQSPTKEAGRKRKGGAVASEPSGAEAPKIGAFTFEAKPKKEDLL